MDDGFGDAFLGRPAVSIFNRQRRLGGLGEIVAQRKTQAADQADVQHIAARRTNVTRIIAPTVNCFLAHTNSFIANFSRTFFTRRLNASACYAGNL